MFEDLSSAKKISIDLETVDPTLKQKGNGARRDGYILGIAVGTDTGIRQYYPIGHSIGPNICKEKVLFYLKDQLNREKQPKIGANILYDLEYLSAYGVPVKGPFIDVQIAEPLIDENRSTYSLDSLAQKYLNEHKKSSFIEEECNRLKLKGDFREHLDKFSSQIVGEYALGDVDLPLRIFEKQKEILKSESLVNIFHIESKLLPLLLQMKIGGCRLDVQACTNVKDSLLHRKIQLENLIKNSGIEPEKTDTGRYSVSEFLKKKGYEIPHTPKTNKPKITSDFLKTFDLQECRWLVEYYQLTHFIRTFLESQLLGSLDVNSDRIHSQFNSLRDSDSGTVTGRFSSSHPNLQNMPSRNSELAPKCRSLFLPEEGELFGSIDYSQIEIRIMCHFAMGQGSEEVREAFRKNPKLDMHQWCADIAGIDRKQAKNINFGILYGQGVAKTARILGLSIDEARLFLNQFNNKMPFAKYTAATAMIKAENRGWVKTILGRRRRFPLYESSVYEENKEYEKPLPFEEAKEKWGYKIKRSKTYKAINAIVQGSSADLLKLAMVTAYEKGIFNILKPLTTVHDELNVSVPDTKEGHEAYKELVNIMETCYTFKVPIIAEAGLGKNWSEAKL